MKVLVGSKYLMDMETASRIIEVEELGSWDNRKYRPIGEPADIRVIRDSEIVDGADATEFQEQTASKKLEAATKELEALKLVVDRSKAVDRIMAEKRGVSRADAEAWAATITWSYNLAAATSDDVRKWMHNQSKKETETGTTKEE
jgi:predicted nucleic acid-binding protein